MRAKLIITFFFFVFTAATQAQPHYEVLAPAMQEFSNRIVLRFEEIPITWTMQGLVQAEFNEGYNNLLEGHPAIAENNFTTVLTKDKTLWQAHYFRAAARKQLNKHNDAIQDLTLAIELNPKFYEAYIELAKIYAMQFNITESERALTSAIKLDKTKTLAYYLRGDLSIDKRNTGNAIENYKQCLAVDNLFQPARIKLALIALLIEKSEQAGLNYLNDVIRLDSLQQDALLFRSIIAFESNKEQSFRDLSKLIVMNPNNLKAYYLRGMLSTISGKFDQAFTDFQFLIKTTLTDENQFQGQQTWVDKKIDIQNVGTYTLMRMYGLPDEDAAMIKQAYCYIITADFDKSIALLEKIQNRKEPLVVYLKAVANEHKGLHKNALQYYNYALALDDGIVDAYKKRGIYFQEMKMYDKSIEDLSKVLKLTPDAFVIYRIRGVSYYYFNKFKEAISDYSKYLEHDSTNKEVMGFRGMAYLKGNQVLKAYIDFARSDNQSAFDFTVLKLKVDSTLVKGDTASVVETLKYVTDAMPTYTEGYVQRYKLLMIHNNLDEVSKSIAKAIRNSSTGSSKENHAYLLTIQAMIHAKNKDTEKALIAFNEAIKFDDKNSLTHLERGKLYVAMGKTSKAESDFKEASALGNEEAKKLLASITKE